MITMSRAARLPAARVAVLLAVALLVASGSWSTRAFGGMTVPDVGFGTTPVANAAMTAVSCVGDSFCMAVGSYSDPSRTTRPLAEKWNGQAWHVEAMLTGDMNSVSCVSASFCMAVGKGAAIWDGARWHPMRGSPRGEQVSCSRRSFCMVVRTNGAASWNGKAWHRLPLSITCLGFECHKVISALRCTSTSFCMAVGSLSSDANEGVPFPVAEEWNGARWAEISVPSLDPDINGSGLTSVSCTSTAFCLAVGPNDVRVRWDGHVWTALYTATSPDPNAEVSCVARDHCYLIGGATFESWINGTLQTLQAPSAPAGASIGTAALACGGITVPACTVVGGYSVPAGGENMTLAERWTGAQWLLEPTPTPGDLFEGLSGVSCRGASFCMAVGSYHTAADTEQALAEQWNGHRWQLLHPVSPGTQMNYLASVSCPTRTECVAVGSSDNQSGHWHTLAELWNGISWSALPTLDVLRNNGFSAISCPSARTCMAVGSSRASDSLYTATLAEEWDGATWKVLATPDPGVPVEFNVLSGISCIRPGWCMAVGYMSGGGHAVYANALAMVWNGTSWRQVPAPNPGGNMELDSVSCTRTVRCVAAGQYVHGGNPFGPVAGQTIRPAAQVWNGKTWIVRKPPRLAKGQTGLLYGVSCAAGSRCMAVGEYITTAGAVRELADAWNGRAWSSVRITSLSSPFSDLFGIDCTGPARCLAVGEVTAGRTLTARWNGSSWHSQNAVNP
jgi:hypothetical protein